MSPLVSIIIPAYNAEKWIRESIQSALAQSWRNTEIIVVDDGSTDGTRAAAEESANAKVRILHQPNGGAARARNAGLAAARGKYIQFLDADDLLSVDKIELQMGVLEQHGDEVLCSGAWGRFQGDVGAGRFSGTRTDGS